jgi:hypothetical protein
MRVHPICKKTLAVAIPVLLLFACKKGDTGPAGPAGPAGPTGATGAIGTANVIYSDWFTAAPWIKDTVFDVYGFNYTKTDSNISQKILDSGTVITFGKLAGYNTLVWPTGTVAQLPIVLNYKFSSGGITYTDTWSALATPGKLRIRFVNDQNYYGSIATSHQFRYIIIPGGKKTTAAITQGVVSSSGRQLDPASVADVVQHYQDMSYATICQRLGVPE